MNSKAKVIKIITVSAVILIFLLVISLIMNIVKLVNANSLKSKLESACSEIDRKIEENDEAISELNSDEYVEWYAREFLNMKGRDEDAFKSKE